MGSNLLVRIWQRLRLIPALMRLTWRYLDHEDVWTTADAPVPLRYYGSGCIHEFPWYFTGHSSVFVADVPQLCQWLSGCEYVSDQKLFQLRDFWQHPCTFEQLRRGDCEDHAVWAWRKLTELGLAAELVCGSWPAGASGGLGGHAWVVFSSADGPQLLEATLRQADRMVRPLEVAKPDYVPRVSVRQDFRRFMYGGFIKELRGRPKQEQAKRTDPDLPAA
jgi:hypothetical protein